MADDFKSIDAAIRAALVANADFAVLKVKVHPLKIPQGGKPPVVTVTVISDMPEGDDLSGNASLYRAVIEVKTWERDKDKAEDINEIIRLALQGYQGLNLGVKVYGIHHLHMMDDFEAEVDEYNKISRFSVLYRKVNPDHEA